MNVRKKVVDLLSEILSGDPYEMDASFALTRENDVAPIDIAKLTLACENAFRISLYDEKIADWKTVGDACRHIEELLEEGQAEATERSEEEREAWFYE
ncbi:MAG TPA: acyl carrier protein [Clostridia bacterium]|nr:acyl carrier protein [Clostridia bacterium]